MFKGENTVIPLGGVHGWPMDFPHISSVIRSSSLLHIHYFISYTILWIPWSIISKDVTRCQTTPWLASSVYVLVMKSQPNTQCLMRYTLYSASTKHWFLNNVKCDTQNQTAFHRHPFVSQGLLLLVINIQQFKYQLYKIKMYVNWSKVNSGFRSTIWTLLSSARILYFKIRLSIYWYIKLIKCQVMFFLLWVSKICCPRDGIYR